MGPGRLMEEQKQAVIELVEAHRSQGRTVAEVLGSVGVARSSYYRWKKNEPGEKNTRRQSSYEITGEERKLIDEVKEQNPQYRHRRIQGLLQQRGVYLSASVIYGHLKQRGQIEPYERRAAPWKSPRYEVWQRNQMWGSDWTKLSVGGIRWYLLTVIDFFSRWIIAWEVVPTVHAGTVKAIYQAGLNNQGISLHSENKARAQSRSRIAQYLGDHPGVLRSLGSRVIVCPGPSSYRQRTDRAVLRDDQAGGDLSGGELSR